MGGRLTKTSRRLLIHLKRNQGDLDELAGLPADQRRLAVADYSAYVNRCLHETAEVLRRYDEIKGIRDRFLEQRARLLGMALEARHG